MGKFLLFALFAVTAATTLDSMFFQFLPSSVVSGYYTWVGVISAIGITLTLALKWDSWKARWKERSEKQQPSRWLRSPLLMGFGSVVLGVIVIQSSLIRTIPHVIVVAMGEQGSREFTVKDRYSGRRCRKGLELEGLPFLIDRVCGIAEPLYSQIEPGMSVIVRGRTNWAGIVPETVEIKASQD